MPDLCAGMPQKRSPLLKKACDPMSAAVGTYEGRPCTVSEMAVGNTRFTVISVQSDSAGETAFEKVKKLILDNCTSAPEKLSQSSNKH